MQVAPVAVACPDAVYLAVRVIEDHVLANAVAGHDLALPPGQYQLSLVSLHLEISRVPVLAEPHELSLVVDNHRTVLPGALLRGDEDVARSGVVRLRGYLYGRRAKLWTPLDASGRSSPRSGASGKSGDSANPLYTLACSVARNQPLQGLGTSVA